MSVEKRNMIIEDHVKRARSKFVSGLFEAGGSGAYHSLFTEMTSFMEEVKQNKSLFADIHLSTREMPDSFEKYVEEVRDELLLDIIDNGTSFSDQLIRSFLVDSLKFMSL